MTALLGGGRPNPGGRRLLLVKARIDANQGAASAPAQGPMALGAVARALGWDVRCLDSYLVADPERALCEALHEFPAEVVGVSGLTAESRCMHRLAAEARRAVPGAVILAGGAHASAEPEKTAADPAIDAAVLGEGERTLIEILQRIERSAEWRAVDGLAARRGGAVRLTAPRAAIEDLAACRCPPST